MIPLFSIFVNVVVLGVALASVSNVSRGLRKSNEDSKSKLAISRCTAPKAETFQHYALEPFSGLQASHLLHKRT